MFIAWWSGKGYHTGLIVLGTLAVCGALLAILPSGLDNRWFWSLGLVVAALFNWIAGRSANRVRRSKTRGVRDRLFCNARHRFMSVPMETFSIFIFALAIATAAGLLVGY
jgi:hypothetical protein